MSPGVGYGLVGTLFVLWSLLVLSYPILRPSGFITPWGFVIGLSLGLAMALALIVVSLRRHTHRLEAANKLAADSASGLAASEQQLRDFAEVSSDWLWEMGPDLRFIFVSENLRRSIDGDPLIYLGQRLDEMVEVLPTADTSMGSPADLEARRPFRDLRCLTRGPAGQSRHLLLSGKPIVDAAGRFLGYRGSGRDVTANVEASERASRAQHQLVDAINGLSQGIALYDRDDRLVAYNPAYIKLNELDSETIKPGVTFESVLRARVERGLIQLQPPETVDDFVARRLDPQRRSAGPVEVQTNDRKWFLIHDQRLGDGGYAVAIADISSAKQHEQELAEKTKLLQSMLENLGEGISVFDRDLRLVLWNDRMIEMVGQPRSMYRVGMPFEDVVRFSAERGEYGPGDVEAQIQERITMSTQPHPHRNARWRVNGRYVELRRNPMPGGGFVTVYSDLTDRQRVEDALRDAKEAAESANRTKSEILANMSHELRTPLNGIIGFSDIILREAFGAIGQKRYLDYARDIHESGTHLLALINDILDVSKAEAGRIELLDGLVEIPDLFNSCVRLVRPRADEAKIDVVVMPVDHLPRLQADGLRLKQVLINLLSNAVKFTSSGGRVTLSGDINDNGDAVLRVEDTGVGMAPEDIPKALSPFGQLEQSLARRHAGTGLGLPLSKALVELHGGRLEITSKPGVGTTVSVILPRSRIMPN
jgi:signal transduction histidine kinase